MNQKYKIAFYKEFPDHENLQKSIQKLKNGDFSKVKKLTNSSYFRIKVDYEDRIIFTFLKYQNENFILLLEYIPNHEYEKSQFLRGKVVDEEEFLFPDENQIDEAIFINNKNEFRYLEKFISFSESQENILTANPPIILIGSAGSGKTSILIEKIRNLNGRVLYTSLSKNLVENSKNICNCFENGNIDFLTFGELFNIQNEVNFEHFKEFAKRYKIREIEKYFEEFRGVIAGTFEESYLSEEKYLNLGLKESIFNQQDKKGVYDIFNKYLNYLKSNNLSDSNMQELNLSKNYDFIVIDEVQDFTNSQIFAILKYGQNFILSGDSNQIIYSNFFSWSKLKTMLFKTEENSQITILKENYRNSESITNLSNKVLKIKQLRFGSIDRESNYLINTVNKQVGKVSLWFDKSMVTELNEKKRDDVNFAVVVFDENSKQEAKKSFQTPLIFTVQEAKGLEYKNIILFNFISNESKKFLEIISDLKKSDLENELQYSRPKDKTDRELDIYKIYINSLYVALTRGIENIYIFEKKEHRIFEILGLIKSKKEILKQTSSDTEIWKKEVEKLEKFGRTEQIENIQKRQKERVSTKEHLENLQKEVFENGNDTKNNRSRLFKYAKVENNLEIIQKMAEKLDFKNAKVFLDNLGKKDFQIAVQNRDIELLQRAIKAGYSVKNYNISELVKSDNDLDFLELLLKNGANADSINEFGQFVLIEASQKGDTEVAKLLVKNGANLDLQNEGFTALTIASQYNHVAIVSLLIKAGADVNVVDNKGLTPLIWASQDGYLEVVKLLIENDADINFQDSNGRTALMLASQDGYFELVKYLLDKKAKVNIQNVGGISALTIASENGHTEIAKLLIENKANVNLETKDGLTALISASGRGNLEVVKLLLKFDVNLEVKSPAIKTNKLMTALEFAMENKNFEIVELLKQAGAKFSFKDDDINSILQKQNPETLENFIKSGNSVKDFNIYGLAYSNTNLDVIEILLKHGADVNSKSPEENSPLNASTHNGNLEVVKLFVKYGANVNSQNNKGDTALMWACIDKQVEIVKFLLTIEKLELNLQANDGWSALMFAVESNSVEIVELLINAKADLNLKNYGSLTALEMAKTHIKNKVVLQMNETQLKNKNKIVQLLKQAGAKE